MSLREDLKIGKGLVLNKCFVCYKELEQGEKVAKIAEDKEKNKTYMCKGCYKKGRLQEAKRRIEALSSKEAEQIYEKITSGRSKALEEGFVINN